MKLSGRIKSVSQPFRKQRDALSHESLNLLVEIEAKGGETMYLHYESPNGWSNGISKTFSKLFFSVGKEVIVEINDMSFRDTPQIIGIQWLKV